MSPGFRVTSLRRRSLPGRVPHSAPHQLDEQRFQHNGRAMISEHPAAEIASRSSVGPISTASPHHPSDPVAVPLTVDGAPDDNYEKAFTHWHPAVPSTSAVVPSAAKRGPAC
jgi:hypothetical protein